MSITLPLGAMRNALRSAPIVYGYLNTDLVIEAHNELGAAAFGFPGAQLVGRTLDDVVQPHVLPTVLPRLQQALAGHPVAFERPFAIDGTAGSSTAHYLPHYGRQGGVLGVHIFIWDTSKEKAAREAAALANDMFARAFDTTAVGMALVSAAGQFLQVNIALCDMLGFDTAALLATVFQTITHPEDLDLDLGQLGALIADRSDAYTMQKRYLRCDGSIAHGLLSVAAIRNPDRSIRFFVSQIQDISDRVAIEHSLKREHELSRVTLESIGDAVITFDATGHVTFLNPVAERLSGWSNHDARGKHAAVVFDAVDRDGAPVDNPVLRALETDAIVLLAPNSFVRRRDGTLLAIEDSAAPIRDDAGQIMGAVLVFHDVSEQRAMASRMEYLAHYDMVTGLANRALFRDRVEIAIADARARGEELALLFCDLDRFKSVNDLHGHYAGDAVLKEVANRLTQGTPTRATVCRWSGDEFAILVPGVESARDAADLAGRIVRACSDPIWVAEGNAIVNIGASVGISLFPADGQEFSELIAAADAALYAAKAAGRNRFFFHRNTLNREAKERARREVQLHAAIRDGSFLVLFQPQIALASGQVVGAEALVRMQTPEGIETPDSFIGLAESTGLIDSVTLIVFRLVCQQLLDWQAGGFSPGKIAINLSPLSLKRPGAAAEFSRIAAGFGLRPDRFEFEITEGVLVETSATIRDNILALKKLGFSISLDDFGTGFSNLGYLRSLPVDTLKIDRSFISDPAFDREIVGAIISLGRALGKATLAEGIESQEQMDALIALGCDLGQGYLFAPPLGATAFMDHAVQRAAGARAAL